MQVPIICMKKKKNQIMKKVHKIAEEGPNRNGERLDGKKRWRK